MHGGDIYRNQVELDFSVNLNPLGMPANVRRAIEESAAAANVYPDPEYQRLRESIGRRYHADPSRIVCGNGASELIFALCRAFATENEGTTCRKTAGDTPRIPALILAPGFTGYRRALRSAGVSSETIYLSARDQFVPDDTLERAIRQDRPSLVLLSNPANPSGALLSGNRMQNLARLCAETGTILCVDECFMELTGHGAEESLCAHPDEAFSNLIVLNAVTKTYAIPGIRLGYAFCGTRSLADCLRRQLPEWNISCTAQAAGIAAMETPSAYLRQANQEISAERSFLQTELRNLGFQVIPSEAPYILFHTPYELYPTLLAHRILIRDCADYEGLSRGWYRIAVRSHEDNQKLIAVLRVITEKKKM